MNNTIQSSTQASSSNTSWEQAMIDINTRDGEVNIPEIDTLDLDDVSDLDFGDTFDIGGGYGGWDSF